MASKKHISANNINVSGDFIAGDQYNYYYTGDFASLAEYYISPEPVFQRVRTDDFIGRDWLTAKVDSFLNDPQRKSGAFLLIGDAGVGKTSFMAHLVKERRYLHLFAEQAPGQAMLQRAMQSLASQLVSRYQIDPYKDRDTLNALSVFPDFLERILRLAASTLNEGEKIVIVCDALDEAGVFPDHFVFGLPKELPDGVYLILSQRPVNTKLPNFEPLRFDLEAQGEDNLQDMEAYLSAVAKRPAVAGQIRAKDYSEDFFIQTLKEKSFGVWMYLHYVIKEIERGQRAPLDLESLPKGLVGYYADYWDNWRSGRKGSDAAKWDSLYAPLLATLAAIQEAITVEKLIEWADVQTSPNEVTRLLSESWSSFITEKEEKNKTVYMLYHQSLRDFITGKVEDIKKLPPTYSSLVSDLSKKKVEAHKRIVNAFETECNGEWEQLAEQDYPRLHLTTHLSGAKAYKKLINLLTEGDEHIKWAEAREKKEETYDGYINDLARVWEYAEQKKNYSLMIRCMLIENSIHSLASNIQPKLLVELAKSGLWSYVRCLSTIQQKSDSKDQSESLKLLAPHLPPMLLQEAILIAREIKQESNRVNALSALASCLAKELRSQVLQEALMTAYNIQAESIRTRTLAILVSSLTEEQKSQVVQKALEIAHKHPNISEHFKTLTILSPHLTEELAAKVLQEGLEIARKLPSRLRARPLTILAPNFAKELRSVILQEALDDVREKGYSSEYELALVLEHFAPLLDDKVKNKGLKECLDYAPKAVNTAEENFFSLILEALAAHFSGDLMEQALSKARQIKDEHSRIRALTALAAYLTGELKLQVLQEALIATREIKDDNTRADNLVTLAPYLTEELKSNAIAIMRKSKDSYAITRALEILAPFLSEDLELEAYSAAHEIQDEHNRARALEALIPYLTGNIKSQIFSGIDEIQYGYNRAIVLAALAPRVGEILKSKLLSTACEINIEQFRAMAIIAIFPHLTEEMKSHALSVIQEFPTEFQRADILKTLAPHLSEKLKLKVLLAACELEYGRARVLEALAPYLPQELNPQAITAACQIKSEGDRAEALAALAPYLSETLILQVLFAARKIDFRYFRTQVLVAIAPHLDEELKSQVFQEAIVSAKGITGTNSEYARIRYLTTIIPYLDEEIKVQVFQDYLAILTNIEGEHDGAQHLLTIFPKLTKEQKIQALSIVRNFKFVSVRASTLAQMIPYLTEQMKTEAIQDSFSLAIEWIMTYDFDYSDILVVLSPHLTNDQRLSLLSLTHKIREGHNRTYSIAHLSFYLPLEKKLEVFQSALYTEKNHLSIIMHQWKQLDFSGLDKEIIPFIKFISQKNRDTGINAFGAITPALIHFSGKAIVPELYRAITDVTRWWP